MQKMFVRAVLHWHVNIHSEHSQQISNSSTSMPASYVLSSVMYRDALDSNF